MPRAVVKVRTSTGRDTTAPVVGIDCGAFSSLHMSTRCIVCPASTESVMRYRTGCPSFLNSFRLRPARTPRRSKPSSLGCKSPAIDDCFATYVSTFYLPLTHHQGRARERVPRATPSIKKHQNPLDNGASAVHVAQPREARRATSPARLCIGKGPTCTASPAAAADRKQEARHTQCRRPNTFTLSAPAVSARSDALGAAFSAELAPRLSPSRLPARQNHGSSRDRRAHRRWPTPEPS